MSRREIVRELCQFVWFRRKFVLAPLLLLLLLFSLFIMAAEIPALTPFIYALF